MNRHLIYLVNLIVHLFVIVNGVLNSILWLGLFYIHEVYWFVYIDVITVLSNSFTVLVVSSLAVLRVYVYNLIIWKQFFLFSSNYVFSCFIFLNYIGEYLQHNIKNQWKKYIHLLLLGSNVKASSISYIEREFWK